MNSSNRALVVLFSIACALVPAAVAAAKDVRAELRVEGGQKAVLDSGHTYKTSTVNVKSSTKCGPTTSNKHTVPGSTALGLVSDASKVNRDLNPFRVSDTFGFGLIACEIGGFGSFSETKAWLYKVNHKSPEVGGDLYPLKKNDSVLWFFANFFTGANTGDELVLKAPNKVKKGETFQVHVNAYDFAGVKTPAEGVTIAGGTFGPTDANGISTGKIDSSKGFARLRGSRGLEDIPTAPKIVCERGGKKCPAL